MPSRGECIGHSRFSDKDIERLEARVAALKDAHEFDDENHAYIEAAAQIASEAGDHKENILSALQKEDRAKQPRAPRESLPTFDNLHDLVHAVAKENLPAREAQVVADAYMRMKEEGADSRSVAKEIGVGKSTVNEWMEKFDPLVHEASKLRLFKKTGESVEPSREPEEVVAPPESARDEKPAEAAEQHPEEAKKDSEEGEEEAHPESGTLVAGDLRESGDLADEANHNPYDAGEERSETDSNINISDNPYGEGNSGAFDKLDKDRVETLTKKWQQLNKALPKSTEPVAFKDLGLAQQRAFDAEARKSDERARKAHRELTELRKQGIEYNEMTKGWTIIEGNDDQPKPQLGKRLFTSTEAWLKAAALPAVANTLRKATIVENVAGEDVRLLAPDNLAAVPLHHALVELVSHPAAGPFFKQALANWIDNVYLFKPQDDTKNFEKTAAFFAAKGAEFDNSYIAVNIHADPYTNAVLSGDTFAQSLVARTVAHELTHAADNAAKDYATLSDMASTSKGSRLFTTVDVETGWIHETSGDVTKEIVEYLAATSTKPERSANDMLLREYMAYPMRDLFTMMKVTRDGLKEGHDLSDQDIVDLDRAERRAAVEGLPRLVELRLNYPDVLKAELPSAYDFADNFIRATTPEKVLEVLRDDRTKNLAADEPGQGVREPGESRDEVSGEVRPASAAGGARVGEILRDETGKGASDRGPERPPAAEAAGGGNDRLSGGGKGPPPELPRLDTSGGPGRFARSIVSEKLYRTFPQILGALSVEQLSDRFKEHPAVQAFSDAVQRMGALANKIIGDAQPIVRDWHAAKRMFGADKDRAFGQFLIDQTQAGMWADKPFNDPAHDHLKPKPPGEDATPAEIADYEAMLAPLEAKHAALKKQFEALPDAYKRITPQIEQLMRDNFQRHVAADHAAIIKSFYPGLEDNPRAPKRELIDQAAGITSKSERTAFMKAQTDELVRNRISDLWEALDDHQADYKKGLEGPYFPLQRFGDHIVSYKSKEFRAAEEAYETAKTEFADARVDGLAKQRTDAAMDIDRLKKSFSRAKDPEIKAGLQAHLEEMVAEHARLEESFAAALDAAKAKLGNARETLNDLKADSSHYSVEFYENRALALQREKQLNEWFKNDDMEVKHALRDQYFGQIDKTTPSYVNRIADHLSGALEGPDREAVRRTVREMYILNLPGSHSLKSTLRRKNVPGVKPEEALRSFATKATKDAFAISRKLHMPDMTEHTNSLRYGDNTNEDAKLLGAELAKRMVLNSRISSNKAVNFATNWTYFTQLGLSPGFMLMQGTQQWINTAPMMAARHGVRAATSELAKGTGDAAKLLKVSIEKATSKMTFKVDLGEGVKKGLITEKEQAMLQNMFDHGRIDIASAHDAAIAAQGADPTALNRAAQMANWPVQQMEVINRISTALAGYRAEMRKLTKEGADSLKADQQAQKYADRLVSETHMNYALENRARFIHPNSWGGWGRIMFQFRAYQQGMAYLTIKNIVDGMRGDKEARKAAMYMAGVQIATGGLTALPVPAAMTIAAKMLYNAFTEDDDEKDLKEMLFQGLKSIGGDTFATAAMKGLPAVLGADVSAKLGAGNTFDVVPFLPPGKEGKDLVASWFLGLAGGPAGGDAANYAESISQASQGNFAKAATGMLPKFAADLLKAEEFQRVGTRDTHGNQILSPDEISGGDSVLRALGVQPTSMSRVADERTAFYTAKRDRDQVRQKLLASYAAASLGEGGDKGEIMGKIHEFNGRHPDARIAPGALPVAVQKRREFERNLRSGVPVGKRDRQLYEEVLGE